jgi:hypothetical protein
LNEKILRKIAIAGLVGLVGLLDLGGSKKAEASQPSITLATDPPISQVVPFKQPVQLTLEAKDDRGTALKNVRYKLKLLTPAKTPWFTTDFPIVEGTTLLDLEATPVNGKLALQQVFPIRGTYQFGIEVTPLVANEFKPISQNLTLTVPENSEKYVNLAILAGILLAVGWMGGLVIGSRQPMQPGELAPQRVRFVLSGATVVAIAALLAVNISVELTHSHDRDSHHETPATAPSTIQSEGLELKLLGDTHGTVGQLAQFAVAAVDVKTGKPATDVVFQITTTQLEDNELTFAYAGTSVKNGQQEWQQQFFDGAPHRIDVTIAPQPGAARQFKPFRVSKEVDVAGVAPPLSTRLISLGYFTGFVSLGLVIGLWQQKQKSLKYAVRS